MKAIDVSSTDRPARRLELPNGESFAILADGWAQPGYSPFNRDAIRSITPQLTEICRTPGSQPYVFAPGVLACACPRGSEARVVRPGGVTACEPTPEGVLGHLHRHNGWWPGRHVDEPVLGMVPPVRLSDARSTVDVYGRTVTCRDPQSRAFVDLQGVAHCGCVEGQQGWDFDRDLHTECGDQRANRFDGPGLLDGPLLGGTWALFIPALVALLALGARRARWRSLAWGLAAGALGVFVAALLAVGGWGWNLVAIVSQLPNLFFAHRDRLNPPRLASTGPRSQVSQSVRLSLVLDLFAVLMIGGYLLQAATPTSVSLAAVVVAGYLRFRIGRRLASRWRIGLDVGLCAATAWLASAPGAVSFLAVLAVLILDERLPRRARPDARAPFSG